MKQHILFLLCLSHSLTATDFKDLTKEEKWRRIKEVFMSGEVSYSILATVMTGMLVKYLSPLVIYRITSRGLAQKMDQLLLIINRVEDKQTKELAINQFCIETLHCRDGELLYNYDDPQQENRTISIALNFQDKRKQPNLRTIEAMLQTAPRNVIKEVITTISNDGTILKLKIVV